MLNDRLARAFSAYGAAARGDRFVPFFHVVENLFFVKVSADAQTLHRLFERISRSRIRRREFRTDRLIPEYRYDRVAHIAGAVELREFGRIYQRALLNARVGIYIVRFDRVVADVSGDYGKVSATLGKFFYRLIVARADEHLNVSVRSIGIKEKRRNHFDYAVLEINY